MAKRAPHPMPEDVHRPRFEVLDHTADTGISATAGTLEELVETMATGMFSLMAQVSPCSTAHTVEFEVGATPREDLVYECLSELLYLAETEDLMFCAFQVRATGSDSFTVTAGGVPIGQIGLTGPPIKAVTYHQMEIREAGGLWHGKVYFDV